MAGRGRQGNDFVMCLEGEVHVSWRRVSSEVRKREEYGAPLRFLAHRIEEIRLLFREMENTGRVWRKHWKRLEERGRGAYELGFQSC